MNRHDPELEVWRIEIRAGKKELKDKYQIRTIDDLQAGIGDVIVNEFQEVRYRADRQSDANVSRQDVYPLWARCQEIANRNLTEFRSGLTPGQVMEIERELARSFLRYRFIDDVGIAGGEADEIPDGGQRPSSWWIDDPAYRRGRTSRCTLSRPCPECK